MIDEATLRHVARLARIDLAGLDLEQLRGELGRVLDLLAALDRADRLDVGSEEATMALRPDVVIPSAPLSELLAAAPAVSEDGAFLVPKVLP